MSGKNTRGLRSMAVADKGSRRRWCVSPICCLSSDICVFFRPSSGCSRCIEFFGLPAMSSNNQKVSTTERVVKSKQQFRPLSFVPAFFDVCGNLLSPSSPVCFVIYLFGIIHFVIISRRTLQCEWKGPAHLGLGWIWLASSLICVCDFGSRTTWFLIKFEAFRHWVSLSKIFFLVGD